MFKNFIKKLFGSSNNQQEQNPSSSQNNETKTPKNVVHDGTPSVMNLETKVSPRQILSEHFPDHQWPISGGWGYDQEDAVVIEVENGWEGVHLEYEFLKFRTYEEAIFSRHKGKRLAVISVERDMQSLVTGSNGKNYDKITMIVTAFIESDLEFLKKDWEEHNAYEGDEEGKQNHLRLRESKKIQYEVTGWFDISHFY